ncbi:hypothetical protein EWM64_g1579 [Hericium alpestre]|uniref:Uncharacterized protein n=1 Tax=Hericium alpestre TaxID=135208 RepID=A0A4Z0A7Y8_9AGAM|nr:hypothetical protein EWM64_g1579 [Hericium alpestre]
MPHSRSRSRFQSPARALPGGADPISESDYYNKSPEFSVWLKDEKRKVRMDSIMPFMLEA